MNEEEITELTNWIETAQADADADADVVDEQARQSQEEDASNAFLLRDTDTISQSESIVLNSTLRGLFFLNGFSLSLQTLPLMYLCNERVMIPLQYLPLYGSIAFLPYSLKPIFALLGSFFSRPQLFTTLLLFNGLSVFFTALIPKGWIFMFFVTAFMRGVFDAWAELNLGLTLVNHAHQQVLVSYDRAASVFQSQAATSRNVGTLAASFITCILFLYRLVFSPDAEQLSDVIVDSLMAIATVFNLTGAYVSWVFRENIFGTMVSSRRQQQHRHQRSRTTSSGTRGDFRPLQNHASPDTTLNGHEESTILVRNFSSNTNSLSTHIEADGDDNQATSNWDNSVTDAALRTSSLLNISMVVSLQLAVISLVFRSPISEMFSFRASNTLTTIFLTVLLVSAIYAYCFVHSSWGRVQRVGLFLLLRHTIPEDSILMGSFRYSIFQDSPLMLQLLSLAGMMTMTVSSWTYTRFLSQYSDRKQIMHLIAGTTMLAAFSSLSNLILINQHGKAEKRAVFLMAVISDVLVGFSGEWKFLPDIVLATTSIEKKSMGTTAAESEGTISLGPTRRNEESRTAVEVEYGSLISCIDFGDQLGALLGGPLVVFLGISRENDFANLDRLVWCCFAMSFLSILLLPILRTRRY